MGIGTDNATGVAAAATTHSRLFIATMPFWPFTCATCSARFFVDAGSLAAKIESGEAIFCPDAGHANRLDRAERQSIIESLSTEVIAAKFELHRIQLITGIGRKSQKIDPHQAMKIAARAMAAGADMVQRGPGQGGKVCPICGFGSTSEYSLVRHILRQHKAELGGPVAA